MSVTQSLPAHEAIRRYYEADTEREWTRLDRHRTEFYVTLRALHAHLPPPPARVLDCGGGPGRYAIELAQLGYGITLFDLSAGNLAFAREKAAEAGVTLAAYAQGTATDLSRFPNDSFDAVLLLGPLYHLLEEDERLTALREAYRVVKPGGPLFAAFISRYAAHRDAAAKFPLEPLELPDLYAEIQKHGRLPPRAVPDAAFVGYFAHPDEVAPLCWKAGFEVLTVLGVEGLVSSIENYGVNDLTGPAWDYWVDLNYRVASDPTLHGAVEHLLVVARKPPWRTVLREVARRLNAAGVPYTIVGGTSPALHGVPLAVNDIDIETDAEGAYRFQALFSDQVVQPVKLSANERYRSHFGRFDFDGVSIEVMGDLHRREGEAWVPTQASTQTTVEVDGVPVCVSWLEEETLAYIRRGRLDRAAQFLPYCDHGRLLALLSGQHKTHVL